MKIIRDLTEGVITHSAHIDHPPSPGKAGWDLEPGQIALVTRGRSGLFAGVIVVLTTQKGDDRKNDLLMVALAENSTAWWIRRDRVRPVADVAEALSLGVLNWAESYALIRTVAYAAYGLTPPVVVEV